MSPGVIRRKKSEKVQKEPRSSDEIRCLYMMQLWEELERLQSEVDEETDAWLTTCDQNDPHVMAIIDQMRERDGEREFLNELMDAGEPAWLFENTFVFRVPERYSCDHRILDLLKTPDVGWSYPSISIGIGRWFADTDYRFGDVNPSEWDNCLVVEVMLIDG